jgi:hypothetical protein
MQNNPYRACRKPLASKQLIQNQKKKDKNACRWWAYGESACTLELAAKTPKVNTTVPAEVPLTGAEACRKSQAMFLIPI